MPCETWLANQSSMGYAMDQRTSARDHALTGGVDCNIVIPVDYNNGALFCNERMLGVANRALARLVLLPPKKSPWQPVLVEALH